MKVLKKFVACLAVGMMVSFAFAQEVSDAAVRAVEAERDAVFVEKAAKDYDTAKSEDKTLNEYLDELSELLAEEKALDKQFRQDYEEAMSEILASSKEKTLEVYDQEKFPWENPCEYDERLNNGVLEVQESFKVEIGKTDTNLSTPYKISKAEIANRKVLLWAELKEREFICTTDQIEVEFEEFDVYNKYWPVVVKNTDETLPYTSEKMRCYPNLNDIENGYKTLQAAIDANEITSELTIKVQQKNSATDTYEVHLTKVVLYGSQGDALCTFLGEGEVIKIGKVEAAE